MRAVEVELWPRALRLQVFGDMQLNAEQQYVGQLSNPGMVAELFFVTSLKFSALQDCTTPFCSL